MRAIIVAAGMGRRLAPYTDDRPKCLVEINGRAILDHQIAAYRRAGVDDICVVRGYRGAQIDRPGIRTFDNPDYARNNILRSLFYAEAAMDEGFLFSYSDIVFRPEVAAAVAAADEDYALVVDRRWADAYAGRDLHPVAEAELAEVSKGRVLAVGKRRVTPERAHGEFIGLARFSRRAAARMRGAFRTLVDTLGDEAPFGNAPHLRVAYLTDLLNHLIAAGETMAAVDIDGGWREIDTTQDLERARAIVDW